MSNPVNALKNIVGDKHCITDPKKTASYRKGFRFGGGEALAVVTPGTLVELWKVAQCCVDNDIIMIMQAANTGLTGGSTPYGDYDRDVVIVNTVRLTGFQIVNNGEQVLAFPGSRLYELEAELEKYGREPHSVIGSSCIGASVVGGVCNNSGGALVHRGPAYTEMAIYGRIDEDGKLVLVNHLGVELGDEPEAMLAKLEAGDYQPEDVHPAEDKACSCPDYQERVRDIEADTPARFNNDARKLYEASGCAGKLIVFAVRLNTFPKAKQQQVFYIGTNDTAVLTRLRRHILGEFENLPVTGEFLHRSYFDVCDKYGKDSFIAIQKLGSQVMPKLFATKAKVDRFCAKIPFMPKFFSDKVLQLTSHLFRDHLPKGMRDYREKYEHHLILEMADDGVEEARAFLQNFFKDEEGDFFECTQDEGERAILHRFVAGGAAKRYHAMKNGDFGDIMALDIALRRNEEDWFEVLPPELDELIEEKFYCGHFMCHVMHQDYIVKKGVDAMMVKDKLLAYFDAKGAEYPAEHNVGQQYFAKAPLANFYRQNDPTNSLNPGIGKTAKYKHWEKEKK